MLLLKRPKVKWYNFVAKRRRARTNAPPVAISVPQEIVNAIVKELRDSGCQTLKSCSLVCSAMMWATTEHLMNRVAVTAEDVPKFIVTLRSSARLRHAIRELRLTSTVVKHGNSYPNHFTIRRDHVFALLSLLPALEALGTVWVDLDPTSVADPEPGDASAVRRPLAKFSLNTVDPRLYETVLEAVDGVDTVHIATGPWLGIPDSPRRPGRVRAAEISCLPTLLHNMPVLFDSAALTSVVLDFGVYHSCHADALEGFLEVFGLNLEQLRIDMPYSGLTSRGVGAC